MDDVWLDGRFVSRSEARLGVDNRGYLLGEGAFETMRLRGGRLRRWSRHRARLAQGLKFLGLNAELDSLDEVAKTLAARLGMQEGVARLTVTGARGGGGLDGVDQKASCLLTLRPQHSLPHAIGVAILPEPRRAGLRSERFKLSGYGGLIEARRVARTLGADRAVVTGRGGALACADCANLFWIKSGQIFTPAIDVGALPGTTRASLIEACAAEGLGVEEVEEGAAALLESDACFTTNAIEAIMPIARVDHQDKPFDHQIVQRLIGLESG